MRELTVRIRFTTHCLGDVKGRRGRFLLPRSPAGRVVFLPSWHRMNLQYAAQVFGRHQDVVGKIAWDLEVDAVLRGDRWFQRYFTDGERRHYALHESFVPGQVVGLNCVVPEAITDDDLWQLLELAGRYRGLSPYKPKEHGFFKVESIRSRRGASHALDDRNSVLR